MSRHYDPGFSRTTEQQLERTPVATIVVLLIAAIAIFALLVFLFAEWGMEEWLKAGSSLEAIVTP